MPPKKVSQDEWAQLIAKGVNRHELEQSLGLEYRLRYLRKHVTVPIVIGLAAILVYVLFYGFAALIKDFLSWTIGITVVTTALAIFGPPIRRR